MLFLFTGTDRKKARAALQAAIKKASGKNTGVVRVSDSSEVADLRAALGGRGMFDSERIVVLDGIFVNPEMLLVLEDSIARLAESEELFFIIEEKVNAAGKRLLAKYVKETQSFEAPRAEREDTFFAVTGAFRAGKKKELWVLLQREYAAGKAPEMLQGTLFWAAKQMVLKPRGAVEAARGKRLVAELSALPHEARRRGEDLEYALERFVLSGA